MHVTTPEAALAGALISALAGGFGGLAVQRATKTRDHLTRIWENRAAIYEAVLLHVFHEADIRTTCMNDRDTMTAIRFIPDAPDVEAERRALTVRLIMYGAPDIRIAYRQWQDAWSTWAHAFEATFTDVPDGDDVWRMARFNGAREADKAVSAAMSKLVNRVIRATQEVPKRQRK